MGPFHVIEQLIFSQMGGLLGTLGTGWGFVYKKPLKELQQISDIQRSASQLGRHRRCLPATAVLHLMCTWTAWAVAPNIPNSLGGAWHDVLYLLVDEKRSVDHGKPRFGGFPEMVVPLNHPFE